MLYKISAALSLCISFERGKKWKNNLSASMFMLHVASLINVVSMQYPHSQTGLNSLRKLTAFRQLQGYNCKRLSELLVHSVNL